MTETVGAACVALYTPNSALKRAGFYNLRASQEVCP
jgi:hypothetical protein